MTQRNPEQQSLEQLSKFTVSVVVMNEGQPLMKYTGDLEKIYKVNGRLYVEVESPSFTTQRTT